PTTGKEWEPPFQFAVAPLPSLNPPTVQTTASSRSLTNMLGPDPRLNAPPPGAMVTAVGTF
ncbi:MAG: hypothetical protein K0S65_5392, partial [Labilithrix sp.]|nr:hypothetical protein [Labilithrix sp.]